MGGWIFPENLRKEIVIEDLENYALIEYHDNLHIVWIKILEGYKTEFPENWTLIEIYEIHQKIIEELKNREIGHLASLSSLDEVKLNYAEKKPSEEENIDEEPQIETSQNEQNEEEAGIVVG